MTTFILTIVISALAGAACGYLYARYVWQDRLLEIEEQRQELRRKRLEIHREQFQESTSRIHRPSESTSDEAEALREDLEQLRLEMMLLKEDHRLEKQMLEDDRREAIDAASPSMSSVPDVEDTDAVILEEDVVSDDAEEHPELDDALIDAVVGTALVQGPTLTPEPQPEPEIKAEDAPELEPESNSEVVPEPAFDSESEPSSKPNSAPEPFSKFEAPPPPPSTQDAPIAPVPSDIESLFGDVVGADMSDEIESPDHTAESQEIDEPGIVDEPVETFEAEQFAEAIEDSKPAEERKNDASPDIEKNSLITELPASETTMDSESLILPDVSDDEDSSSFSIHWQSDRPRRHKMSQEKPQVNKPDTDQDIPVFRSLHDMLSASGVSYSDEVLLSSSPAPASLPQESKTDKPSRDKSLIRRIVNLDDDSFSLLSELGYAKLERLAGLSPSEIRRLAAVFRIHPERIEQEWKPTATAHLNMLSAS